jgi:hypothetical protein
MATTRLPNCKAGILLAALWLSPLTAAAQDGTFVHTIDGDFNKPGNWDPAGVPTRTATVGGTNPGPLVYFSAPVTKLAAIVLTPDFNDFTILATNQALVLNTGAGLTVTGSATMTVNGTLTGKVALKGSTRYPSRALRGTGTIEGDVQVRNGRIQPGSESDPQGKLTIGGNFVLGSTGADDFSYFDIVLTPSGQSNKITVLGNFSITDLNSGYSLQIDNPGAIKDGTTYTILTATGTITGRNDQVSIDVQGLIPIIGYSEHEVTLTLYRRGSAPVPR